MQFSSISIMLVISLLLVACGGGDDKTPLNTDGENYCILNTHPEHFSPNGSCFQLLSLDLENPFSGVKSKETLSAKTSEYVYFGYTYDEDDFVGDLKTFTYELSFESDDIADTDVRVDEPLEFGGGWIIYSNTAGTLNLTFTVKDQGFVLGSMQAEVVFVDE